MTPNSNHDGPLQIELEHFHLQPFQELKGRIRKQGEVTAKSLELHLFWFTRGRGDEDAEICESLEIDIHRPDGAFTFKLPAGPYSFAGQLITLAWALELVDHKGEALDLVPFLLSPTGEEIQLEALPKEAKAKGLSKRSKWGRK